jgi:hypothetical protein
MSDASEKPKNDLIDLFAEFSVDKTKADNGVLVPYKNGKFLIASASNRKFVNARDALYQRYPTPESLESEEAQLKYEDIIANHILLGWEGFKDEYTHERACQALRMEPFRKWVMGVASKDEMFRALKEEKVTKN